MRQKRLTVKNDSKVRVFIKQATKKMRLSQVAYLLKADVGENI